MEHQLSLLKKVIWHLQYRNDIYIDKRNCKKFVLSFHKLKCTCIASIKLYKVLFQWPTSMQINASVIRKTSTRHSKRKKIQFCPAQRQSAYWQKGH